MVLEEKRNGDCLLGHWLAFLPTWMDRTGTGDITWSDDIEREPKMYLAGMKVPTQVEANTGFILHM